MAIRRINYTNRKRLDRKDVTITVIHDPGYAPMFDAAVSLEHYRLPNNALIFIEAYRQTSLMRFPCGTVADFRLPPQRWMTLFDTPDGMLFRVKVTADDPDRGMLLAEADRIPTRLHQQTDEARRPILPVKPDSNLRDEVFRLNYDNGPLLLINARVGNWKALARSPAFMSLAYPQIIREILVRIVFVETYVDLDEDSSGWEADWLRFATLMPGISGVPRSEDKSEAKLDWIDEVVSSFARRLRAMRRFAEFWERSGSVESA